MKILFPENQDNRVIEAVNILNKENICEAVLGNNDLSQATKQLLDGEVDVVIAGAAHSTADVLRAGIKILGTKNGLVSSFMLMEKDNRTFAFADCAVVPEPSVEQLTQISINTADNFYKITRQIPNMALLSYSTLGSAQGESVEKMRKVKQNINALRPDLNIDGELQFDAAFDVSVANIKSPDSNVAGRANVFIFPDLNSGNIGYKIAERLGGATVVGPIVQGLNKPMMDLSRGCNTEDIINLVRVILKLENKNEN
jgi:phosphate acetyltransferase